MACIMSESATRSVTLVARRRELLAALESGPVDKPTLVESLQVSRSTVDRAVRELEDAALVERAGGEVSLTAKGRVLYRGYLELEDTATGVQESTQVFEGLPADNAPHPVIFAGGDVIEGSQTVPNRPLDVLEEYVEVAHRIDAVTLSVVPRMVEAYRDAIIEDQTAVRMTMPEVVIEELIDTHEETLSAVLETDADLRQAKTAPPYGALRFDTGDGSIAVLLSHGNGGLRGMVRNDSPLAVAWATTYLDQWADRSTPL